MKPNPTLAFALLLLAPLAVLHGADVPQSVKELWADFDPRKDPLEPEVLKEWEQDGVVCRIVRYQVGTFKGAPSKVAAFYAFAKGGGKRPAILDIHGGGQSASLSTVVTCAQRGYVGMSINWGGNKMSLGRDTWGGPQTDWDKLDATHPPQRNPSNHFAGPLTPDDYTLDAVESPRNSNWFLVLMAARRAVTFLEQQPETDPARIGARGHSMGGKLTTNLAGIDHRIKAAVPSCGGSGDIAETQADLPGTSRTKSSAMELACISDNAYIPLIACPVLWLSPTNDFHAHIDNMAWNWRDVPDSRVRFSISPHLNHRHTDEHAITEYLWFEEHLKGASFRMPQTPGIVLDLKTTDGVPRITVTPDDARPVRRVDVYYSIDPHALTRFWRDARAVKAGAQWKASAPVMSLDRPIFAYANVVYETPAEYRASPQAAGRDNSDTLAISSRVLSVAPAGLQSAGVKATDTRERLIDDGTRGWHDWYLLNWGHAPLWTATTRKLKDPKWRGPDGATLHFDIQCQTDNTLVVTFNCNAWGAFIPGKPAVDYTVVKSLKASRDWQTVSVSLGELTSTDPKQPAPLASWQSVTEFTISPSGTAMRDGQKVKIDGKPWQGPRNIRNLRWEGGTYAPPASTDGALRSEDFQKNFNDAIRKSLEQEKLDRK
ncbi:alpha/beta hydrolase family protein [Humisphaera borealis]|uniref:Acetylxylan esterase n=1 Tax=Humisphaera borealis TaxID=2807512 RepID=A0A7M2X316_9BACT|nr:acetylxylan esterase [Humisphaera borealis]QOV92019.1 acetylxylan esterase [Humisphaera borealis]